MVCVFVCFWSWQEIRECLMPHSTENTASTITKWTLRMINKELRCGVTMVVVLVADGFGMNRYDWRLRVSVRIGVCRYLSFFLFINVSLSLSLSLLLFRRMYNVHDSYVRSFQRVRYCHTNTCVWNAEYNKQYLFNETEGVDYRNFLGKRSKMYSQIWKFGPVQITQHLWTKPKRRKKEAHAPMQANVEW